MISARSVKFRLTVWHTFILAVLLSVFAFWMYHEFARVLYRDTDRGLASEADRLADAMETFLPPVALELARSSKEAERQPFFLSAAAKSKLLESLKSWEHQNRLLARSTLMVRFVGVDHALIAANLKGWEKEVRFPDFERDSVFMEKGESFQTIHFHRKPIRLFYRLVSLRAHPLFILQLADSIYELKNTLGRLRFIILISILLKF